MATVSHSRESIREEMQRWEEEFGFKPNVIVVPPEAWKDIRDAGEVQPKTIFGCHVRLAETSFITFEYDSFVAAHAWPEPSLGNVLTICSHCGLDYVRTFESKESTCPKCHLTRKH